MNIFITGASSGIGRAVAAEFVSKSHRVFLASRNTDKLSELCSELNSKFPESADYIKCDVTVKSEIVQAITAANEKMGSIDVAFLNSGVGGKYFFKDPVEKDFRFVMDTNFYSVIDCFEFLVPIMQKQGKGHISVVSSMADARGFASSAPYGASKAALTIALESARAELKPLGITVSTVRPGFVKSSMTDKNNFKMPFLMETDKAAKIITRSILKNKRQIYFPWQMKYITNLLSLLPDGLFDKLNKDIRE